MFEKISNGWELMKFECASAAGSTEPALVPSRERHRLLVVVASFALPLFLTVA